jgi:hypothetical protein
VKELFDGCKIILIGLVMDFFLILLLFVIGIVCLAVGIRKKSGKNEGNDLVVIREGKSKDGKTVITIDLNEKGLKSRLRGGSLHEATGEYKPDATDIAGFYGSAFYSPDGRCAVAIDDSYEDNGRRVNGKIALVKDNRVIYKKTLRRPMDAAVNDSGVVACCDALEENMTGQFYCFDPMGSVIFIYKATANLGICAVSADSTLAFFETYGSEASDSNSMFVVDLIAKCILHKFIRPYPFNKVEIDTGEKTLALTNAYGFVFICDFEGRQTNKEEYEIVVIDRGTLSQKIRLYEGKSREEQLKSSVYLDWLIQSLKDGETLHVYGAAWLHRRLGELNEELGKQSVAVKHFEKALEINPKIGVKRRLEALKKRQHRL